MDVKKTIKTVMLDKGIKTGKLAELSGMDKQYAYNLLSQKNIGLSTLTRMADALNCDIVLMDRDTGKIYGKD